MESIIYIIIKYYMMVTKRDFWKLKILEKNSATFEIVMCKFSDSKTNLKNL